METHGTTRKAGHNPANLNDTNIIITGGTTGIGRATAMLLASQGANVLIAGRDEQALSDALADMNDAMLPGKVYGMNADLATEEGIRSLFAKADEIFPTLHVHINNAALAYQDVMQGAYEELQYLVNTNLVAYMACAQEALKRMEPNGRGHIINVGSMSADVRESGSSVYVATKSGIQGLSEALRKEVNPKGIKVSLIEPGAVGTDMQPADSEEQRELQIKLEMMRSEDIAAAVLYTLSQPERAEVVELKIKPLKQII